MPPTPNPPPRVSAGSAAPAFRLNAPVVVPLTYPRATRRALAAACALARDLDLQVRVLVPCAVSPGLDLNLAEPAPPHWVAYWEARLHPPPGVTLQRLLVRDPSHMWQTALQHAGLVVLARPLPRFWSALATQLRRNRVDVVILPRRPAGAPALLP